MTTDKAATYDRIIEAMLQNVDELTEKELLLEGIEEYGSEESISAAFGDVVDSVMHQIGTTKLKRAKEGYLKAIKSTLVRPNILMLPLGEKRKLIEQAVLAGEGQITLAAREALQSEDDIDSILQDFIELGLVTDVEDIE